MAERIRGLQIDIGLNDMGINRKLSEIKRSFRTLNTDLKLSRNNFINSEKSMTSYKNRVRELDGALSVSKKNLKDLRQRYQEVSKEQGHNSKTAQSLRQEINRQADTQNYLQKELNQTTQDFKEFQKSAREAQRVAGSGWGKMSKTFESMGPRLTSAGNAMKGVGRNMSMYVTAPIVGGFGLAVKTAADFEGQMSRVGAIAESSKGELKAMSDQAVDLGAKTSKSAAEVAQGMEELAALGFNAQEIMKAMPSVISASEASGADMAETATIMASSLNAFGLEAKDSGHVADLLAMAANKSAADISYMGDALKYAGPPAKALNVSLEDTSAAIGIMSDAGLEGSQAGTALRASFIRLANPTKKSSKAMEELGVNLSDSKGNFVGMPKLVEQFKNGMKGMSREQKLANVAQIVGTEAASGFLTLIEAGPTKIDKFSKSLKNSDGASKKAADRMKDNLKGSLEQLSGAFESAGIIIGNIFSPVLRKLADMITWLVEKLNGMSKGMQITMVVLASLAAVIGPLVFVFGAFIAVMGSAMTTLAPLMVGIAKAGGIMAFLSSKIAAATTMFPALGSAITLATGPVGWIAAAIVALGIAFVVAYKKSETFRNIVNSALNGVKQTFVTVGNIVKGFFQLFKGNGQDGVITLSKILPPNVVVGLTNFATKVKTIFFQVVTAVKNFAVSIGSQISAFWSKNGAEITQAVKTIGNVISTVFKFIWSYVIKPIMTLIWNLMKLLWPAIKMLIVSVWNNIKGVIQGALNIILGVVKVFSALLTGNWKGVWQGIVQILRGAVKLAWNLVQLWFVGKILKVVKVGLAALKGVVTKNWRFIHTFIATIVYAIWNKVKAAFSGLYKSTRSIFTNLSKWSRNLWTALKNKITSLGQMIWTNVRNKFNGLYKSTRSIFTSISKFARNLWTNLKNAITKLAQNIWTNVRNKFTGMFNSVRNTLNKLFNSAKNIFTNIKNSVTRITHGARDNVVNGFKAMYNKGKSWISKLKNFLSDSVSGFKSIAKKVGAGVANGAIKGLNAMIKGINALSDKIMKKKLIKKDIPEVKLSTGTGVSPQVKTDGNGLLKRGTRAVVNDKGPGNAKGPNGHKELIYRRSGKIERPIGNNKKVRLRRGDGVINGTQSKSLLPHFANGSGVSDWLLEQGGKVKGVAEKGYHSAKDGAKGLLEDGKELTGKAKKAFNKAIGDVMDYVKNPMKLVDKTMNLFGVDFSNIKGAMGGMMQFGYKGLKKSIKDLVEGWFAEAEGGDGDSSWLLKHNILQTFGYYKGMTMNGTNRHWGVDFGMPEGTKIKALTDGTVTQAGWVNGGGGNQVTLKEPGGKWFQWYMHMMNGGVKVKKGQKVKAGDLLGLSGNTGSSNTPHLHIQRMKGYPSNDTAVDPMNWLKSLKGGGGKSGKWDGDVKEALRLAGLPTTAAYVNAWKRQIQTESSGNPRAEGPGSSEGTPKGLVQVKTPTFNAYKLPGHGNIWNGLDNLIAGMRYAKATYGKTGLLNQIGHGLPYKTGGVITQNGLYNLAEDGHSEVVVPLDPARATDAMKLIAYAQSKVNDKKNKRPNQIKSSTTNVSSNENAEILQMLAKQIEQQQEQINILTKIALSNQDIADKPVLSEREISKAQGKRSNFMAYNLGGAY
ncbi:phage tail tape measure protein [Mammaliicoccus sciuri]|uniref:phage tail tape measure protein n=1 Tax=Mammaliicoccus sciuri TaxID=1296 RepID=UPI0028875C2B|nr:phage tail tape measure protein [Mammaliicoccus sciuri]MDT0707364.1 phage tail tape measure protein [Mammaliicoccus sciuri]